MPCGTCGSMHRQRIAHFDRYSLRNGRALRQLFRNFDPSDPAATAIEAYNAAMTFAADPVGWSVLCTKWSTTQPRTIAGTKDGLRHR